MGGPLATKLYAQNSEGLVFSVPFAFTADGSRIAAGTYALNLVSNEFMMSIRNLETGDTQVFSVRPEQQRAIESRGRHLFHRCGSHMDLAEFHVPGTNLYSETITPGRMKKAESKACPATVFLAAR